MTKNEYDILIARAQSASNLQADIEAYQAAVTWLMASAFHFRLGGLSFSEVPPGLALPDETWKCIREEITKAIEQRIKELKQEFKEL